MFNQIKKLQKRETPRFYVFLRAGCSDNTVVLFRYVNIAFQWIANFTARTSCDFRTPLCAILIVWTESGDSALAQ